MLGYVRDWQPTAILRVSAKRRRMLGYVYDWQPTVIFRVSATKKVNAWICARRTTHHDLVCVIPDEKRELTHEKREHL